MNAAARPEARPTSATSVPVICPCCGEAFHCGAADAAPCGCAAVELPADITATLRAQYRGCLCLACLRRLGAPPPG